MMRAPRMIAFMLLLLGLVACEDTAVHTTPPAPVDSENAPTITVEPSTVGPNTPIRVTGQGYPPDTLLELRVQRMPEGYTAAPLGQATTDAEGNITLDAQVPALWLDGTRLSGPDITLELTTQDGDIRGVAVVPFEAAELESYLEINPPDGAPGQEVRLMGHGFAPGTELAVRLGLPEGGLSGQDLESATVDPNGEFQALITIPKTWPDTNEPILDSTLIIALVDTASGETAATASFTNQAEQAVPQGMDTPAP